MKSRNRTNALPFSVLSKGDQRAARLRVMRHIRDTLLRGPHSILELRAGLEPVDAGALTAVMETLVSADEIAALGHCVYARVPWMPQLRPVEAAPVRDLVLCSLPHIGRPRSLASWLGMPLDIVMAAIGELEQLGVVEAYHGAHLSGRYHVISSRMTEHLRRGARGRAYAEVITEEPHRGS
jgi:hypothetical protein